MSHELIAKWHAYMDSPSEDALASMLHEEVCFISPVVHTPQQGKAITMKYLLSAGQVFKDTQFKYVHELQADNRIVLEFECMMEGKFVNGVDIIDFDADGLITQFKVMVRPLQALNMLWQQMGTQLEQASAG